MKRSLIVVISFVFFLILAGCQETTLEFDVNFDSNGGTPVGTVTTDGNTITLPENPTKEGYEFDGWYWDDETFNDPFTVESLQDQPLSSDITLYAKWSEISTSTTLTDQLMFIYNLSQEADAFDGTYEEWLETVRGPQGLPGEDGRDITLQLDNGYIQWKYVGEDSWTNLLSLDSITGADGQSAYDIYLEYNPEYSGDEETWMNELVNGTLQNTAELTVTFDYNDETTEPTTTTVNYLGKITEPATPTRDGYTFTGWTYMDQPWSFIGFIVTEDMTLTATWEETEYVLQFLDKSGEVYKEASFQAGDDLSEITYPVMEMDGYSLVGWEEEIPAIMPAHNVTLQSIWQASSGNDVNVLDEVPTDPITISFWHMFGDTQEALLDEFISDFETMYPNITIQVESFSGSVDLFGNTTTAIETGSSPTMVLGYGEHLQTYQLSDSIIPLDEFYSHDTFGIDVSDFIPAFIQETSYHEDDYMYSLPFSKVSNVLIYNKTLFEANNITVPEDGTMTWEMLNNWADIMKGTGTDQCEYFINYDSPSDLFVNSTRMWGGQYTSNNGDILIDDSTTISMLEYLQTKFNDKTFTIPLAWNQYYGSTNFINQDVCMTVGSLAGLKYNIPQNNEFEVGVAPVPQYDLNNKSASYRGPNVAIMSETTDAERLVAWLFMTYLTNSENSAEWAIQTGYQPVRYSSYETNEYQSFLTNPASSLTYQSMGANAAYQQIDYLKHYPIFVGPYTSFDVYQATNTIIESIYNGNSVIESINNTLETLGQNTIQIPASYTDVVNLHNESILDDTLDFRGYITAVYDGGYVLTDNVHSIIIYSPGSSITPTIGDEVYVKGTYATYHSLYQINDPTIETIISSGNSITQTPEVLTIGELLALDSTDKLVHGMPYTISGMVEIKGEYDNVYITDGTNEVLVYYYSLPDSLTTLEALEGTYISETFYYFTDHSTNGVMLIYDESASDVPPSDMQILINDGLYVQNNFIEATISDITLPSTGPNGSTFTNWTSSRPDIIADDGTFITQDSQIVTVSFTADATYGGSTDTIMLDVVVPSNFEVGQILNPAIDTFIEVTGTVYAETTYGFYIEEQGEFIFVYDSDYPNSAFETDINNGDIVSILGTIEEYNNYAQVIPLDYNIISSGNPQPTALNSTVATLANNLIPYGTVATITGTVSLEGQYDNVVLTGPYGESITVNHRTNADEIAYKDTSGAEHGYVGQIITIDVVYHQNGTVLFFGTDAANDITVETAFSDEDLAQASLDAIDLGNLNAVISDLTLPAANASGDIITWTSSNTSYIAVDGSVTRPTSGDETVTLTASITIGSVTETRDFVVTVKEDTVYTSVQALHTNSVIDDTVEFRGIITSVYDKGYILTDGTYSIIVYAPNTAITPTVGDKVYVKGTYSEYYTAYQISNPTVETPISSGNTISQTAEVKTVSELLALDSNDKLVHGMPYTVTGTLEIRGSYDNVYIVDGTEAVVVYYESLPASITALENEVGNTVTITVYYYTDHDVNGPMFVFDGDATDIN